MVNQGSDCRHMKVAITVVPVSALLFCCSCRRGRGLSDHTSAYKLTLEILKKLNQASLLRAYLNDSGSLKFGYLPQITEL